MTYPHHKARTPVSFDKLLLREIRRRLPDDVDVVAQTVPIDTGRRVDPRVARGEVTAAETIAVGALAELWLQLFPGEPEPADLRLRWVPTMTSDAVSAEAATRQPGAAGVATAAVDRIEAVLDQDEWSWTRRDPTVAGNVRIMGRRRDVGFDLGIRTDADVVLLRTRSQPAVVGSLAAELVETPIDVSPWPAVEGSAGRGWPGPVGPR
jgi:hypothetical protein